MNSRYTLASVFLLSSLVSFSHAYNDQLLRSDLSCSQGDRSCLDRASANGNDVLVGLAYLLSREIPDQFACPFGLKGRIKKEVIKYYVNRYVTDDSVNLNLSVPTLGNLPVLTNDNALEVGYFAVGDLLDKKAASDVLVDASQVYVREKVADLLVWLLGQTKLESLLPSSLSQSQLYALLRKEVARYTVENGLARLRK